MCLGLLFLMLTRPCHFAFLFLPKVLLFKLCQQWMENEKDFAMYMGSEDRSSSQVDIEFLSGPWMCRRCCSYFALLEYSRTVCLLFVWSLERSFDGLADEPVPTCWLFEGLIVLENADLALGSARFT